MTDARTEASAFSVCVFCASSSTIDEAHLRTAAEVGSALASRGWTVVTGGGAISMMGAVAQSARDAGGRTVGVIPEALLHHEVADEQSDELVVTVDMRTRKAEMDRRADAFLVLAGGIGTLEEMVEIWVARTLGMHDKQLVVLDPLDHYRDLRALGEHFVQAGFVRAQALDAVTWTTTVDDAIAALARAPQITYALNEAELLEFEP
jgi:uncharacterized protein (TIGR00730 family)